MKDHSWEKSFMLACVDVSMLRAASIAGRAMLRFATADQSKKHLRNRILAASRSSNLRMSSGR